MTALDDQGGDEDRIGTNRRTVTDQMDDGDPTSRAQRDTPGLLLMLRFLIGGTFMGLANLVPGISGGTMLLATGVYPNFIESVADVSTLKFKLRSMLTLGLVAGATLLAIVLFAGTVKDLVVGYRWAMYSLFIGLTLGGIPVVWRMARPASPSLWRGAVAGFLVMAVIAVFQSSGSGAGGGSSAGPLMMFIAGLAGASAMILPGISGGYLLLVLGVYVPILAAVSTFKDAVRSMDLESMIDPGINVVLPVGIGVILGVLVVSNAFRFALDRFEKTTLGVLLGFLVGAVVGLWPFQEGVAPAMGSMFKGQEVTAEFLGTIDPDKYPTQFFSPSITQIVLSVILIVVGFGVTVLLSYIGAKEEK